MIVACYRPLPLNACMVYFDLVSILFGTSIPTSFNILVKMFLHLCMQFLLIRSLDTEPLVAEARESFTAASTALGRRFEPPSRKTRYQAEQLRKKKKDESWADFADAVGVIAEKGDRTWRTEPKRH